MIFAVMLVVKSTVLLSCAAIAAILAVVVSGLTLSMATIGLSAPIPFPPEPPIPTVPESLVALSSERPAPAPVQEPAQAPEKREPLKVGGDVTAPTVISKIEPDYTPEARRERIEGSVVLEAVVYTDGTLKVQRVIERLEYGLTEAAVTALEQWKFKPAMRKGEPVDVRLNIQVNFDLK